MTVDDRLWIVGCGAMAGAMLHRWVATGADPSRMTVIDPGTPNAPAAVRCLKVVPDEPAPDWLMLGVKPQALDATLASIAPLVSEEFGVLSILAGTTCKRLARAFPMARAIVRVMPNLPVAIGQGAVALYSPGGPIEHVTRLMAPLGLVEWIDDEALFDAVTALSGCGPAFTYRFVDAMAKAGVAVGLPIEQAARLAAATVAGAAAMLQQSDESATVLADRVASPGGSTREGLNVLDHEAALDGLLAATLAASHARNRELGA